MWLSMMNKFSKYYGHYCDILAIGAILDPRMKFEATWFCYSKIDHSTCEENINVLKDNMYKLFQEYVKLNPNEPKSSSSQVSPPTQLASFTNDEQVMDAFEVSFKFSNFSFNTTCFILFLTYEWHIKYFSYFLRNMLIIWANMLMTLEGLNWIFIYMKWILIQIFLISWMYWAIGGIVEIII